RRRQQQSLIQLATPKLFAHAADVTKLSATVNRKQTSRPENAISCSARRNLSPTRSEEHTSELQSRGHLVCRLLLEKKKKTSTRITIHFSFKSYRHHRNLHSFPTRRSSDLATAAATKPDSTRNSEIVCPCRRCYEAFRDCQ